MTATAQGVNTFRSPNFEIAEFDAVVDTEIGETEDAEIGTIGGNRNATTTTINLASAATVTVRIGDLLLLNSELMEVTAVTSQSSFTVTRGVEDTTASAHTAGDEVYLTLGPNGTTSTVSLASSASETVEVGDNLLIDDELMEVTTVTSQSRFTVTRGVEGTKVTRHTEDAEVYIRVTDVVGTYVDLSPWVRTVSWPVMNEGGDATGAGTTYQETVPGEKPKEGPMTVQFMKSFTAGKVDETLAPYARSGEEFMVKVRNDEDNVSATNPEWSGLCHSLTGYMPVTGDASRTDAATVDVTIEISSNMTKATS